MTGNERRSAVLDTIRGAVCRDRQTSYGDAEDNFQNIADYWNLWLKQRGFTVALTREDVAMMSAMIKVARASGNLSYSDNWVDMAGYAVCGAGIVAAGAESAGTPYTSPAQAVDPLAVFGPLPKPAPNSDYLKNFSAPANPEVELRRVPTTPEDVAAGKKIVEGYDESYGGLTPVVPKSYAAALNEVVREITART